MFLGPIPLASRGAAGCVGLTEQARGWASRPAAAPRAALAGSGLGIRGGTGLMLVAFTVLKREARPGAAGARPTAFGLAGPSPAQSPSRLHSVALSCHGHWPQLFIEIHF